MSFKNKLIEIKNKYLTRNSLTTKFSLYYGIILIVILGIALSMGVIGVLFYLSKKILGPLDKITKAEQEISVEKLDKRIDYKGNDTELKLLSDSFDKMIERLETSFNKQNQFISDVSHELKTPISVISGYANLLDRWGKDDTETCNKSIQAIKKETKIIETNRNIYSSNNEEYYIVADISNVKELIRIFIDNAIKYTEENGEINIFSQKNDGKIYINIQDKGIGIAEEEQENIFDRFYRIDKSRSKETGGVGLGLAIAKSIANMNDAEIKLESKQGKGSTFTLIFTESLGH